VGGGPPQPHQRRLSSGQAALPLAWRGAPPVKREASLIQGLRVGIWGTMPVAPAGDDPSGPAGSGS
jgi:hypothetical protein